MSRDITSITSGESEFDESLAVPPSLSVINVSETNANYSQPDSGPSTGVIFSTSSPYSSIYNKPIKFSSVHRKVFIPGVEINLKFAGNERSATANLLNPNLYIIHLSHGDFTWTITKRYKHILHLHQQLVIYRASLNIPFPTKSHKERRESMRVVRDSKETDKPTDDGKQVQVVRAKSNRIKIRSPALPRFPKKPEILVSYDDIPKRMKQLEEYLYSLCNITIYRNHHELIEFLEVSNLSFITELGLKGKEGMVLKKAGSSLPGQTGCDCCGLLQQGICVRCSYFCSSLGCGRWRKRWFFVKDSCFGYMSPKDGTINSVMLFDLGFEVSSGAYSTGLNSGLQILNLNRQMVIKLWTKRKSKEWMSHLKEVANNQARAFTEKNAHRSFAPIRTSVRASSFIDGGGYFNAVADCMEGAKEEIFITDWWLSPEIYLKRPVVGDYWRLDQILKRKAAQGVKIFIMLYKEVEMALGLNSLYSKSQLNYDNIRVIRHPDHARVGVFLWAHHEKIVCIDQSIAFVGGIDLCYGRWDDHKHRLVDLGETVIDTSNHKKTKKMTSSSPRSLIPGEMFDVELPAAEAVVAQSETHPVTALIDAESKATSETANQQNLPQLQPGDQLFIPPSLSPNTVFLAEHYNPDLTAKKNIMDTITGKSKDLLHFLGGETPEPENSISDKREKKKAERYAATTMNLFDSESKAEPAVRLRKLTMPEILEEESALSINDVSVLNDDVSNKSKLWIGKDYANFIVKDFTNLELPFADLVDRTTTPRMPWHDISMMVEGEAARDVARHFIQRWNAHKFEKAKTNCLYPYLVPKSYTNITVPNIVPNLEKHTVSCQVLRSLSCWSGGFIDPESVEQSIHEAYAENITKAQHYIYIENQFFITLSNSNCTVSNQIGEALYSRILRAHKSGAVFRVFVVMPLLPAFEGEIGAPSGTSLHAVTHWNYQSISRGKDSLIQRLLDAGIKDPSQYITFHGLRTHSALGDEPVTELIYVHSKLMIIDDRLVICGSANINDRSMLGSRDSEVAVLINDETFEDGSMNGDVFPSGCFAGSLRKRLFREHLGLIGRKDLQRTINLKDPTVGSFYDGVWLTTSRKNTEIYEEVFHCLPTDAVKGFSDLKQYQDENKISLWESNPSKANKKIAQIQGHLVNFPLEFLADEVLTPPSKSVYGILPTSLWT